MRHYAKLKGLSLSDNGLKHRAGDKPVEPPCRTEAEIYERLGLDWREPCDRELNVAPADAEGAQARADADEFGVLDDEHEGGGAINQQPDSEDEAAVTTMLQRPVSAAAEAGVAGQS